MATFGVSSLGLKHFNGLLENKDLLPGPSAFVTQTLTESGFSDNNREILNLYISVQVGAQNLIIIQNDCLCGAHDLEGS